MEIKKLIDALDNALACYAEYTTLIAKDADDHILVIRRSDIGKIAKKVLKELQ